MPLHDVYFYFCVAFINLLFSKTKLDNKTQDSEHDYGNENDINGLEQWRGKSGPGPILLLK